MGNAGVLWKLRKVIKPSWKVAVNSFLRESNGMGEGRLRLSFFFMVTYSLQCSALRHERRSRPPGGENVPFELHAVHSVCFFHFFGQFPFASN